MKKTRRKKENKRKINMEEYENLYKMCKLKPDEKNVLNYILYVVRLKSSWTSFLLFICVFLPFSLFLSFYHSFGLRLVA